MEDLNRLLSIATFIGIFIRKLNIFLKESLILLSLIKP